MGKFQTVDMKRPDRSKHVWYKRENDWKCTLCGAVCLQPPAKEDIDWISVKYESLTDQERDLCPPRSGV